MRLAITTVLAAWALAAGPVLADGASGTPSASRAPGASEAPACVAAAVERIQGRYESIRDLRASFTQTTRSVALGAGAGGPARISRGSVQFAKPGRMRWSYTDPEPSEVVSDGKTLWIYDPAHAEVQRMGVSGGYLTGAAMQFLLGEGDILREFRVTADACGASGVELVLVPREPASYEKLRLRADPASGEILETGIVDLLGNVTTVAFEDVRTNLDPPADVFTFEAPAGVRVIDVETMLGSGGE